jgi:hypothetical protein
MRAIDPTIIPAPLHEGHPPALVRSHGAEAREQTEDSVGQDEGTEYHDQARHCLLWPDERQETKDNCEESVQRERPPTEK